MAKREEWLRKGGGYSKLSNILAEVTKPVFKKLGYAQGKIASNWVDIVGKEIADYSIPRKILFPRGEKTNGVLHLDVFEGYASNIQHLEPVIIEKIAVYFGYRMVSKIKILQKPVSK